MSSPHPEGLGARSRDGGARCVRPASVADDVDYVNLHGTATRNNDAAEDRAVFALFGRDVPVSSTKGATGHTLGAAGGCEAVDRAARDARRASIPGGVNTTTIDPALRSDYRIDNDAGRCAACCRTRSASAARTAACCSRRPA